MDSITKRLVIALAVSLSLNLFFIGFGVGRRSGLRGMHMRGGPPGMGMDHGMDHGMGAGAGRGAEMRRGMERGMELGPRGLLHRAGLDDAGPEVEKIIDAQRAVLRSQRDAIGATREHVADALQAEPFDAQKFAEALTELRTQTGQLQTQMHGTFVEVAKRLSKEQRAKVAHTPWFMHQAGGGAGAP